MNSTLARRAAMAAPALAGAVLATGLVTAPTALADEGHGCRGGFAHYQDRGDKVFVSDDLKDGKYVEVQLLAKEYGKFGKFMKVSGAGKSRTWNLNLSDRQTLRIYVWLSATTKCTAFKVRA